MKVCSKWFIFVLCLTNALNASNKYILTGGPCCGKTSVLRELQKRGYQTCPEAYSELYNEAKNDKTLDQFLIHSLNQRTMLLQRHEEQESLLDPTQISFCDRSIPDVIFYGHYLGLHMPHDLVQKLEAHKNDYALIFFFEPLPKELYYTTEVRYETWDEAMEIHQTLLAGYKQYDFKIVHVPFDTIEKRVDFILSQIGPREQTRKPYSTSRMIAHRIDEQDLDSLFLLLSDPKVGETLRGGVHSFEQTKQMLSRLIDRWNKYNYGSWMFHDKQTGKFIGRAGLHPDLIDGVNEIVLSYAIMPEYWNNGYATEMAEACIKIGFEILGFESIICFTQPSNIGSQRVMEKNGFKYEKTIELDQQQFVSYRLTNQHGK